MSKIGLLRHHFVPLRITSGPHDHSSLRESKQGEEPARKQSPTPRAWALPVGAQGGLGRWADAERRQNAGKLEFIRKRQHTLPGEARPRGRPAALAAAHSHRPATHTPK